MSATKHFSYASRFVWNCVGCGFEAATVGIGAQPDEPEETYGARCWADPQCWADVRPAHTHLDGRDCSPECETTR